MSPYTLNLPSSVRYPGGGVSERLGCPLPLLAGWPDEVEEEGTCEREGGGWGKTSERGCVDKI